MHKEPDIVKILRDEERLGRLQTKPEETSTSESYTEKVSPDGSQTSVMVAPQKKEQPTGSTQDYLQALWDVMFHSAPLALLIFDKQERLAQWNKYAEQLLGGSTGNFIHKAMNEWYPAEELQKLRRHLAEASGLQQRLTTRIYSSDHQLIDIILSVCILRDQHDELLGTLHLLWKMPLDQQTV
ncbi:MAG TPA: PAS domain-containing protein, partial [Candidatus Thermoplasmatota archaeon]|nr:PAS domain-containing protein [Candidatus Thermoplasmatota archaeon]